MCSQSKNDQTRIASAREAFGLAGLVIAVSMPTVLAKALDADTVYIWYSVILSAFMAAGVAVFSRLPKVTYVAEKSSFSFAAGLRSLPLESYRLFAIYGLSMLASSVPAVLVIFYVRDLLGAEHLTGLFLLLYFLSGAAGMPLWKYISARLGKYTAWLLASILAVTGFISAFFLSEGDSAAYAAVCIVSGLALGADLMLPPSILADQIHACGNSDYSGTHYAFLALTAKAALALASAIALPVLDVAGFRPQADNSEPALTMLSAAYALAPCVLKIVAAGLLYRFFILSQPGGQHDAL